MTDKNRKVIQTLFLIALSVYFVYDIVQTRLQKEAQNEKSLMYTLETYAKEFNEACPLPVGNDFIIEKVIFIQKKTIVYEFYTPKYSKDILDILKLKQNMSEIVIEDLETTESLVILRNKDVSFEYRYFDNQNEEMFRLKVLFNTPITFIDNNGNTEVMRE